MAEISAINEIQSVSHKKTAASPKDRRFHASMPYMSQTPEMPAGEQ
jgi:hypothetical protein